MKLQVVPAPPPPREFVLTLTEDGARAMRAVCSVIGGPAHNTPRRLFDSIGTALDEYDVGDTDCPVSGSIYFEPKV